MPGARRRDWAIAVALLMSTATGACGDEELGKPGSTTTAAAGSDAALRRACGPRLVLQTDWFPQPEHGGAYQLIGPTGQVDKERGRYRGQIGSTGVELEIRAGGPYVGFQTVSSLMYQDQDIFIGYVGTDEAVRFSGKLPTVAVFAPLAQSPAALMWDPQRYDFKTIADIGKAKVKVLHTEGAVYFEYLVGKGLLRREQLDGSYDGSPSRFVAQGDVVQEAYATNEPYRYEHDIKEWGRPVSFLLVSSAGFQPYPQNIAVRPAVLQEKRACLEALVPIMQQAQVDYIRDPETMNGAFLRIVDQLDSSWALTAGGLADAVRKLVDLGIVANGPDGTMGRFDMGRVARIIEQVKPIYARLSGSAVKSEVTAQDIATNEFLKPSIALPPTPRG